MSNDRAKVLRFYLTRVGRVVLACILVTVAIWPVGIQPQATQAAPAYAPQTPTPPASPTPTPPAGEGAAAQAPHTPPSPDNLPPEVEQARARQAMEAALAKYLRYWGPRYQVASIEVAVNGEWAHGVAQWQSKTKTLSGPIHILAHRSADSTWQALMPGSEGLYHQWVDAVPGSLVSAGEKSQLRMQVVEADALRQPQATPAVPPNKTEMPPRTDQLEGPSELVPASAYPMATPTPTLPNEDSKLYRNEQFGYAIQYPSQYDIEDRQAKQPDGAGGVPSDVWFGAQIHVISRIPPLPDDVVARIWESAKKVPLGQDLSGLRIERTSEPIGGGESSTAIEYLIRSQGADYILIYEPAGPDSLDEHQERQIFERMVASFQILPERTHIAPSVGVLAAPTDGFDFFVDPPDGGTRSPWYASYNSRNPYLGPPYDTKKWSPCYNKWMSELQHTGEDWFRGAGGNVHAVANGRVIYARDAHYPGAVVIVEHTLGNDWTNPWGGNIIYSVYSHLSTSGLVPEWRDVTKGQVIGQILNQGSNSHIHFEMRRYGDMSSILICPTNGKSSWPGPGYTDTDVNPDTYGYTNPSAWIDGHRPGGDGTCSAPSLQESSNDRTETDRTVFFRWDPPSTCPGLDVYTFRVVDDPGKIDSGSWVKDHGIDAPGTSTTETFDRDGDFWWAVWPCRGCKSGNPSYGERSAVWHFRIDTSTPPPPPPGDGVELCDGTNYGEPCQLFTEGRYSNLADYGWYDRAESVRFRGSYIGNYHVVLYTERDFAGSPYHADNDVPDLGGAHRNHVRSMDIYRHEPPSPPTADFDAWPLNGNAPLTVSFHNISSGNITSCYWEYGDGGTGSSCSDYHDHTYAHPGTYTVRLTVTGPGGSDTRTRSNYITVNVSPPTADFDAWPLSGDAPLTVAFHNRSSGDYTSCSWEYGDGSTGNSCDAYHNYTYTSPGNYTVRLTVIGPGGSNTRTRNNYISVDPPPEPDLRPYAPSGYPYPVVPSSVQGTHEVNTLYAGQPTYFDWHFINSGGATASGNFHVELWVGDTRYVRYPYSNYGAGWTGGFDDWAETISTPGWHTVRLITDPDDTVAESDENNNIWERQFYWTPTAPYTDDMESGTNDWTATGLWHQVDGNSPYPESHSGLHSWWYGQDSTGNYNTGSANSGNLTSPSVYIPSTGYYLRFWYRYETETQSPDWDQRWVQISVDGAPFENVLQLYDDPMNWWLQSPAIKLSGYAGHAIQVRFHFDTLDGAYNSYRGWYIDDFDISTTPPPPCADSHEPNDTPAQATGIGYGQTLSADICPGGDYDFYTFTGTAGDKVVVDIDAKVNGSLLDSYVFLLDSDGTSVLAEHDDEIQYEVQDSHLGYQLPHDGTYYIKVRAWNHPSVGGTDYFYTIHLLTDDTNPSSADITSPGNGAWLNPSLETITVSASDDESGIRRVEFLWHDADWQNSDWVWLGADEDSRDGWSWDFDTSGLAEQRGGAFYMWAFDWAWNWTGAGVWNLGIDRTPPTANAGISPMYGDAPFLNFYVWWYGSDNLSGIASYDVQYRDGPGGTWTNLLTGTTNTYYRFVGQDGHTYYFRARARDHAGNQSTYAEGDGDAQHTVQICPTSADANEPDNSYTAAKTIMTDGAWQAHNFHAAGDQDWVEFTATAGITYTLVTTNTGGHADTVLYLYESDGNTLIDSNDDDPGNWPASRLEWGATSGGTYYVKVEHWDPHAYGCTTEYDLAIEETEHFVPPINPIFLPMIFKHQVSGPDLVVDSLVATSDAVTVIIRNQSSAPVTNDFWVDVYFNPTETPAVNKPWDTIANHGVVWGVTASIPAGGSLTLTTGGDYYFPGYSSAPPLPVGADVYALVDSINHSTTYGMVPESDEDNNLFGPVTSTAGVAGEGTPVGHQSQPPSMEGLPPRR